MPTLEPESEFSPTWRSSCWTRIWRRVGMLKSWARSSSGTSSLWNISSRTSKTASKILCAKFSKHSMRSHSLNAEQFNNFLKFETWKLAQFSGNDWLAQLSCDEVLFLFLITLITFNLNLFLSNKHPAVSFNAISFLTHKSQTFQCVAFCFVSLS